MNPPVHFPYELVIIDVTHVTTIVVNWGGHSRPSSCGTPIL